MAFIAWLVMFAVFIVFAALRAAYEFLIAVRRAHVERGAASRTARWVSWLLLGGTVVGGVLLYARGNSQAAAPLTLAVGALMQLLAIVNHPIRVHEKMLSPRDRDQFALLGWSLVIAGSAAAVLFALSPVPPG